MVTLPSHSNNAYENMLKLVDQYPDERIEDILAIIIEGFILRFDKIILDFSQDASETETRASSVRRLSLLEREIFDLHRQQKLDYLAWKTQVKEAVNYDMID